MLIAIDVETYEKSGNKYKPVLNTQEFTIGGIMKESGKMLYYTSKTDMINDLFLNIVEKESKRGKRSFIFGHNSNYDFHALFNGLWDRESADELVIKMPNNKRIKILCLDPFMGFYEKYSKNKEKWVVQAYLLDSMGFYRTSLETLGEQIGMEKLEMPNEIYNPEDLKEYLKRDCEIVLRAMKRLKKNVNELGFKPKRFLTAGNVSMTCFLSYCRKNNLLKSFCHRGRIYQSKRMDMVRQGFRGGRTECFKTGSFDNCYKIDINSMYPYIMTIMSFPYLRNECFIEGNCDSNRRRIIEISKSDKIGVVNCIIKSPSNLDYAYLPIRYRGLSYFPLDKEMEGTWTILELKEAQKLGYEIKRANWTVYYDKSYINPLKGYIETLWKKRMESKDETKGVIKLLMNSLYGKFSQYRIEESFKAIERWELPMYKEDGWEYKKVSGTRYIISKKGKIDYPSFANPMVSAWITANARNHLYKEMIKIPKDEMIYVSTDALFFKPKETIDLNKENTYKLCIGDKLGEFKIEDYGNLHMYGENRYKFNDNIHIGGIPKRHINEEVLARKKAFKIKKMISIKEARVNNEMFDKIGQFKEIEQRIKHKRKMDITLPYFIKEKYS